MYESLVIDGAPPPHPPRRRRPPGWTTLRPGHRRAGHRTGGPGTKSIAAEKHSTYTVEPADTRFVGENGGTDPLASGTADAGSADVLVTGVASDHVGSVNSEGLEGLVAGLDALEALVDRLVAVDCREEADVAIADAAVRIQGLVDRLAAVHIGVIDVLDARGLHTIDGAATISSWLRARTNTDPAHGTRLAKAAVRTRGLPRVRDALADGSITFAHVTAITQAAIPRRQALFATNEAVLVDLACRVPPKTLAQAISRLRDLAEEDRDGTDADPLGETGPDERRELSLTPTIDGLWALRGTLDPLTGEKLACLIDAYDKPDAADTPADQVRSPGQRRHDALDALLQTHVAAEVAPTVNGAKPHIHAFADLATLIGADTHAMRTPRLARTGPVPPAVIRRLL